MHLRNDTGNNLSNQSQFTQRRVRILVAIIIIFVLAVIGLCIPFIPNKTTQLKSNLIDVMQKDASTNPDIPTSAISIIYQDNGWLVATVNINEGGVAVFHDVDNKYVLVAVGTNVTAIYLLQHSVPTDVIAKAIGRPFADQLAIECNYSGGTTPGYAGFDSTFANGQVQLDPTAITTAQTALSTAVATKNTAASSSQQVICVNAISDGSSQTAIPNANVTTTFDVQFITKNGDITTHKVSIIVDMNFNTTITLDGTTLSS